jgi:hypothetical protein
MTTCEWAAAVNALAIAISRDKTSEEVAFLGLIFTQLGDTLSLLAATPPKCGKRAPDERIKDPAI